MSNPPPEPHQDTERQPESSRAGQQQGAEKSRLGSPTGKPAPAPTSVSRQGLRAGVGVGVGVGRRRLSLGFIATMLGVSMMPLPSFAAAVAERDARAVRAVIEAQLQAFTAGNAERAFSFASAAVRAKFGEAETFMSMVLAGYPMLVQPAATSFFVPESTDGVVVVQKVQMRDRAGRLWMATYRLQLQANASWRINDCAVMPDTASSAT
jgi:hypothetical protein